MDFTFLGLIGLLAGFLAFIVGIILVCIKSTQKAGLILILSGIVAFLIGVSLCSAYPMRIA